VVVVVVVVLLGTLCSLCSGIGFDDEVLLELELLDDELLELVILDDEVVVVFVDVLSVKNPS